jgi:hypothetical protein
MSRIIKGGSLAAGCQVLGKVANRGTAYISNKSRYFRAILTGMVFIDAITSITQQDSTRDAVLLVQG